MHFFAFGGPVVFLKIILKKLMVDIYYSYGLYLEDGQSEQVNNLYLWRKFYGKE